MVDMELVNALSEMMERVIEEKIEAIVERVVEEKVEAIVERVVDEKVGTRLDRIEERLDNLEKRVDRLENDVHFIKLELENNIRPRLDQIESCYCSTFDRYRSENNKIQGTYIEFDALKDVVQKHSLQIKELQELAGISAN